MQIVILAGGFATRLNPLSNNLPKSLVHINGKPFIYYQLKYFVNLGFDRFVFCLGHLSDQLVNYLNSISEWSEPENLAPPLNSYDDDLYYSNKL